MSARTPVSSTELKTRRIVALSQQVKVEPVGQGVFLRLPQIGSGPNTEALYDIHVARWYLMDEETNPFLHDPAYKDRFSVAQQAGIVSHHTVPLAMHQVLMKSGCAFEKKNERAEIVRTTFAAVGVVEFPDGPTQNGIFSLAMDGSRTIFHAHFNRLSPSEILSRMGNEGWTKIDKKPKVLSNPRKLPSGQIPYRLGDDKSRVTEIASDHITVSDVQGRIFRAFPFSKRGF
jgi:hypothetical protein